MTPTYNIAIVGATGVVGQVFLEVLAEREFPIGQLYLLASERSEGESLDYAGKSIIITNVADFDFSKVEIAFFSAGAKVSEEYVPIAAAAGCVCIDNTSQFRYDEDVPLVVPEVNAHAIQDYFARRIIANPNCSTIQMLVALKPIYDAVGIKRINVATYQSVSGAGRDAIQELAEQSAHLLNGQSIEDPKALPKQIAFNVIPQIDIFLDNGYTKEEMKMVWETKKILEDPDIAVNATAVRVPVLYGHSEAVHIETAKPISVDKVYKLLKAAPGIEVLNSGDYPTAITHGTNSDAVFVGRVRKDISHPNGIDLWVVADNLRKGAATNAVQIAENLIENNFYL